MDSDVELDVLNIAMKNDKKIQHCHKVLKFTKKNLISQNWSFELKYTWQLNFWGWYRVFNEKAVCFNHLHEVMSGGISYFPFYYQ